MFELLCKLHGEDGLCRQIQLELNAACPYGRTESFRPTQTQDCTLKYNTLENTACQMREKEKVANDNRCAKQLVKTLKARDAEIFDRIAAVSLPKIAFVEAFKTRRMQQVEEKE